VFYKINEKTQALMKVDENYYRTKIIEEDGIKYSPLSPLKILDENCIMNGASLEGRTQTVKEILNSKSKLPIPVLLQKGIYMFPTTSAKNSNCIWLSYYQIKQYVQNGKQALVYLSDDKSIDVKTSWNQLDSQIKRTSQVIAYFHRLFLNM